MASASTLPGLLDTLSQSLSSALEATPKLSGIEPQKDGLSLLDVKNELLLSYLQNLVFLILLKIRQSRNGNSGNADSSSSLDDAVVKKLVELRLYLEKGVRPLEDKLRYQIEKVLRAADDAERNAKALETAKNTEKDGSGSESESGSDEESDEENEHEDQGRKISDLQYRPNLSAFVRPAAAAAPTTKKDTNGVYRPPKVAPTVMPTTERRERTDRRALKSATMDEYIADELSAAPMAEPSIGTTIVQGGRKTKTASERKAEAERLEYEERNFVRLPKESKKDRAQKAKIEGRRGRMNFGGEEWRDLGAGVDRINRLTKSKGAGGGTKALLDKSRKRGFETVDGPRGSGSAGVEIGDRFQKRLKTLERGRGKKR
ncbi:putative sas10 utp3 c1d family protein [Phaeoacremonium minimum UCRPA7]|uniref:Putative sas10 utp3 c1d family protein n=1 Tax=Phaeoacremonium minimum (strain UCR-PA7) TaxID=1286976 RepID=R8BPD6_PHAM7|nr:putative sas10 utp3 c1d family protein [Phaeoacremonium minimum UCRPA7]EOO01207.1 putative sas10 utp3 c1d family protein [Phaeoacremonium minimum UCRPA7]